MIGKNNAKTNCRSNDFSLYWLLFSLKTSEKLPSLTKDLINLIPEKLSWTYVDRSDNDSCILSDLLLIIF